MEAIGHLNGLRSATRGGAGILTAAIAADMRNFAMGLHPSGGGFCLPVWQQINDPVRIQVHQHRAERSATRDARNHQCPDTAPALLAWEASP